MRRWTSGLFAALLGSGLVGCNQGEIEERDFAERYASAMCSLERECARGAWLDNYYGQGDCIATWEVWLQEVVELYDDLDCDYSKKQAGDTYADLSSMTCEEWYEDVYTDQSLSALDDIWDLEDCGNINPGTYFPPGSSQ